MARQKSKPVISYQLPVIGKLKQLAVYCLLFTVFTGCASITSHTQKVSGREYVCIDSSLVLLLQKKYEILKTLKGSAQVTVSFKDGREIAGRAVVLVKRPDKFRLEISGPFNQTAFIAIYDGKELSLFSLQENKLYRNYLLPVEASRLPQYLLGLPSSKSGESEAASGKLLQDGCLLNSGDEQILTNQQGGIKEIILSVTKARTVKVSMGSYKESEGFNFPFAISINDKEADISIRYDNIELNRQISDDLFAPLFP